MSHSTLLLLSLSLSLSLLPSCTPSTSPEEQALMQQAERTHQQADSLLQLAEKAVEELQQRANSINVQGRALTEEEMTFVQAANRLSGNLEAWHDKHHNLPGMDHHHGDHAHDHDHDHDHSHGNDMQLTPQDKLDLQKELKAEMESILAEARRLVKSEK